MTARYTPSAVGVTKRIATTSGRQTSGLKALPAPTKLNKRAAVQVVRASDDKVLQVFQRCIKLSTCEFDVINLAAWIQGTTHEIL